MSALCILDPQTKFSVPEQLCALGIMTRVPQAGKVKTRLSPPLTPEEAAELNICFLRDLAGSISQACLASSARGVGIYTPLGAQGAYENILPKDFFVIPQRGNNFGERLAFAAEDLFEVGFESVCLINSDSPTVSSALFAEAVDQLAKPGDRIVLGPSEDGGYYLIGVKKVHKHLFAKIDWSTDRVFVQTKQRAAEIGVEVHKLSQGFDVDDRVTLQQLCDELLGSGASGVAPNTARFLRRIVEQEGRDRIWPS